MPRLFKRPETEKEKQKKIHDKEFLKSIQGTGNDKYIETQTEQQEGELQIEIEENMGDEDKKMNENEQPTDATSGGSGSGNKDPQPKAKTAPTTSTEPATGATKKKTSAETVKLHQSPGASSSIDAFMSEYNYIQCSNISTPMTKISCYVEHTITTHPAVLFTAALTTLICCYFFCRKTLQRNRRWNNKMRRGGGRRRGGRRGSGLYSAYDYDDDEMGEYAALAVYDELLDDFDKEDLSSAYTSGRDDDDDSDDDSIGTIISQWSGDFQNGTGGLIGKRRKGKSKGDGSGSSGGSGGVVRKIELTAFDDGKLSLSEVNG